MWSLHTYIHPYIHTYRYTHTYTYIQWYTHTHTHTYIHGWGTKTSWEGIKANLSFRKPSGEMRRLSQSTTMHTHIHTHTYRQTHIHTYILTDTHTYTHIGFEFQLGGMESVAFSLVTKAGVPRQVGRALRQTFPSEEGTKTKCRCKWCSLQ